MVGGILPAGVLTAAFPQRDELVAHFPDEHEHSDIAGLHHMAAAELRHALPDCGCFGGPDGGRVHQSSRLLKNA
jgi:hypothetical protein